MKLNCLILDDEPLARDVLLQYSRQCDCLNIIGSAENAIEAAEIIKAKQIDLILLDINMPEVSGIDFLQSLKPAPLIIFVTAHPQYAVAGFELQVVDFLLKPLRYERFLQAINKAKDTFLFKSKSEREQLDESDNYILIKADSELHRLHLDDIEYIEALADYVRIHTLDKRLVTLQTMKKMEEKLPKEKFIRVHRSYIVGLNKIKSLDGLKLKLSRQAIPIGKNYKSMLYDILNSKNMLN